MKKTLILALTSLAFSTSAAVWAADAALKGNQPLVPLATALMVTALTQNGQN